MGITMLEYKIIFSRVFSSCTSKSLRIHFQTGYTLLRHDNFLDLKNLTLVLQSKRKPSVVEDNKEEKKQT